ncbi:hypothetical protein JXA80_01280 [bacterium]|nr:hypothetical protein [candidate division CSSED10-310 bacterium]
MKRWHFVLCMEAVMLMTGWTVRVHGVAAHRNVGIYSDVLASGWVDWSWSTARSFTCSDPVHAGTASISVEHTVAWGGLYLHTDEHLTGSAVSHLRFWVHGGDTGGQSVAVNLYDGNLSGGPAVSVTAVAGSWTEVEISLLDLGSPAVISGIVWQDASGGAQPVYCLDDIEFVTVTGTPTPTPTPGPGPVLVVRADQGLHPIHPHIYGMNFADENLASELALPVRRWGGNSTTRYNWLADTSNRAMDWYYENIPNPNDHPELLPDGSASDQFIEQNLATGTDTLMTIPLIGWTPAERAFACGFSVAKYGPQQSVDPWALDCGNGIDTNGVEISGNDPADTSIPADEIFIQDWLGHLTGKYGTAVEGGVRFYNLDNEPMLWNDTHRDVHPEPPSYDEIRDRIITYGAAVKAVDPSAETLGPVTWGWTAYFYSALDWEPGGSWWLNPQDRNAHGGEPFTEWLLGELQAHETASGTRVLDYLDLHYYPQAPGVALSGAGSQATQALRLRTTRSLWDPSYIDESWIGEPVMLLPRMATWIAGSYPGTKRAVTEYNFGALDHINGAVAQADVLGILGREGLDLACLWDPPAFDEPGAFAFRMYRNVDGAGRRFGSTGVDAVSSDADSVSIYAALNGDVSVLSIMIINKSFASMVSTLNIEGITAPETARGYRYDGSLLSAIQDLGDLPVTAQTMTLELPAQSITHVIMTDGACHHDGDVTGDGLITAGDAQRAFLIVLGAVSPEPWETCAADCNGDGDVTAGDAQQIFMIVLGVGACQDPFR